MIRGGGRTWWGAVAALVWLSAMAVAYFVFHKPISLPLVLALLKTGRDLLVAGAIVAVSGGLGRRLLPSPHPDDLAAHSAQAAAGLGTPGPCLARAGIRGGAEPLGRVGCASSRSPRAAQRRHRNGSPAWARAPGRGAARRSRGCRVGSGCGHARHELSWRPWRLPRPLTRLCIT